MSTMYTVFKYGHALGCFQCADIFRCLDWAYDNAGPGWCIEDTTGFVVAKSSLRP